MKIPAPRKLDSGTWFIQLRLNGESIPVKNPNKQRCIKEAEAIKAQYRLDKKLAPKAADAPTLSTAIDQYISAKSYTLSPLTIRGYRIIQKNRFQRIMDKKLDKILPTEWQLIVNHEAALCSPKTLKTAWGFIRSVVLFATGSPPPTVTLPSVPPSSRAYLLPEEIKPFIQAVKDTKYAVPLLLALSSMRISEISALDWCLIPMHPNFVHTQGACVLDEHNQWHKKAQTKNASSARNVPILIPELRAAIKRDRKPSGPVLSMTQNNLRIALHKICKENNLPDITPHGLRHSFASLAYHLQIPEQIAMEIGGWSDRETMRKIYTHISQSDIQRYQNALSAFYETSTAEQNAN